MAEGKKRRTKKPEILGSKGLEMTRRRNAVAGLLMLQRDDGSHESLKWKMALCVRGAGRSGNGRARWVGS